MFLVYNTYIAPKYMLGASLVKIGTLIWTLELRVQSMLYFVHDFYVKIYKGKISWELLSYQNVGARKF